MLTSSVYASLSLLKINGRMASRVEYGNLCLIQIDPHTAADLHDCHIILACLEIALQLRLKFLVLPPASKNSNSKAHLRAEFFDRFHLRHVFTKDHLLLIGVTLEHRHQPAQAETAEPVGNVVIVIDEPGHDLLKLHRFRDGQLGS